MIRWTDFSQVLMKLIDVKPRIDFVEAVHGVGEVLVCHVGLAR